MYMKVGGGPILDRRDGPYKVEVFHDIGSEQPKVVTVKEAVADLGHWGNPYGKSLGTEE